MSDNTSHFGHEDRYSESKASPNKSTTETSIGETETPPLDVPATVRTRVNMVRERRVIT